MGVAAWSFQRRGASVESLTRLVSAESLDGHRIRGRLVVRFHRPIAQEAAEQIGADIAREIASIIGEQICQGRIPFGASELVARVRSSTGAVSSRVSEFHVDGLDIVGGTASGRSEPARASAPAPAARSDRPAARTGTSGVMPAVAQPTGRPASGSEPPGSIRTLWPRALSAAAPQAPTARIGHLLAPALRDSTAVAMLAMLSAIDPAALDRLELLEGRGGTSLVQQLRRETCGCLAAAFLRALVGVSMSRETAVEVTRSACAEALSPDSLPAAEIERYAGSSAPLRDLAQRSAAILGAPSDAARLFAALTAYAAALRTDFVAAASDVRRLHGAA